MGANRDQGRVGQLRLSAAVTAYLAWPQMQGLRPSAWEGLADTDTIRPSVRTQGSGGCSTALQYINLTKRTSPVSIKLTDHQCWRLQNLSHPSYCHCAEKPALIMI